MAGYIEVPWEGEDPDEAIQRAFDYLMANVPLWLPADGHLETWTIEALSRMVSEAKQVGALVPRAIFRFYGESVLGLVPVEAVRATATSTWTMADNQGYTIPEGTVVAWRTSGDTLVPFRVVADVVVPNGSLTTAAGGVLLEALDPGAASNGLPAGLIELVDALLFVAPAGITAATSAGGVDAETDDEYLDRLADELQLLTPRPILAVDFAILARRVAGVHRAVGIDNYNPADSTYDNEKMVTLSMVDEAGVEVSLAIKNAVVAYLEAMREVNFVVNTVGPTYTVIDVAATVKALAGYDPADLDARVTAAITAYLNPGTWGGGADSPPRWELDTVVRYLEVAELINAVAGVDYIVQGTLLVEGGTVDVNLAGAAPLPQPGAIAVAVT